MLPALLVELVSRSGNIAYGIEGIKPAMIISMV